MEKNDNDNNNYPVLRLIVSSDSLSDAPRKYDQSTFGHSSSHVTVPEDSRSMLMANDSPQGREPYATFLRCPQVVPQRSAKLSRSVGDIDRRNSLRSMADYHHSVKEKATPIMGFTKWCPPKDNSGMDIAEVRRQNFRRLAQIQGIDENWSAFARRFNPPRKSSYFRDLIRPGSAKSFGEKSARRIELAAGLMQGQLDIPNSPLQMLPSKGLLDDELRSRLQELQPDEKLDLLDELKKIIDRRHRGRKAG